MKVKELIAELQKCDEDLEIVYKYDYDNTSIIRFDTKTKLCVRTDTVKLADFDYLAKTLAISEKGVVILSIE